MATRTIRKSMLVSLGLLLFSACNTGQQEPPAISNDSQARSTGAEMRQVTGTISYRERIMLRPGAILEVTLLDTSKADLAATVLARQIIPDPGSPPIPFVLEYEAGQIDERLSYSVRATITRGDQLIFTTDTSNPVLTQGAGSSADLMLVQSNSGAANEPLTTTEWKLVAIGTDEHEQASQQRVPHLQFVDGGETVSGFSGCNQFSGSFESAGSKLTMGPIAVTGRACISGMDIERAFLDALSATNRYEITGAMLQLFADDEPVLRFEADEY